MQKIRFNPKSIENAALHSNSSALSLATSFKFSVQKYAEFHAV